MKATRILVITGALMLAASAFPQTSTSTATAETVASYQYFAETGLSYDYYGQAMASTTGFGVRIGQSNAFSVTDIDTPVAQPGSSYATLRTAIEYHVAASNLWEFIGLGSVGATTNGSTTVASFSGGVGVSFDIGKWLSKGKIGIPLMLEDRLNVITANQVKPTYQLGFRKTW
jgi:hypothetical protein